MENTEEISANPIQTCMLACNHRKCHHQESPKFQGK